MLRQSLASISLFVLCAPPSIALGAEITASVRGALVHLPLPTGYCAIDRERPAEEAFFQQQLKLGAPFETIGIAIFCTELAEFRREGTERTLKRYLEFSAFPALDAFSRSTDAQRAQFIDVGAASVPLVDMKVLAEQLKQRGQENGRSLSVATFGLLGKDGNAFYVGGIGEDDGSPMAIVGANTVASNRAITAGFYDDDVAGGTVARLYGEAQDEAGALIAANSPGTPADAAAVTPIRPPAASPYLQH